MVAKAVFTTALCVAPPLARTVLGVPWLLEREKGAWVPTPVTPAFTVKGPVMALAVKVADVAIPEALVVAVATLPAKDPLAPLVGAVKVTVWLPTGLPKVSFTVATSGLVNAVLMMALCGVPPVAAMDAAAPAVFVIAKVVLVAVPEVAVTE